MTRIGEEAFSNCRSLTEITIPDSVTTIDGAAFIFCESLTEITIPDSVTYLGGSVFSYCDNVRVTIPANPYAVEYCQDNNVRYTTIP